MNALPDTQLIESRDTDTGTALAKLSTAKQALIEAKSLDDVLDIRDHAAAIRVYVQSIGESLTTQNAAADIKLRAERKAGAMLTEMALQGGNRKSKSHDVTLKLNDLGVTKHQSSRWQLAAKLPEAEYESLVSAINASSRELTQAALLQAARQYSRDQSGPAEEEPSEKVKLIELVAEARSTIRALEDKFEEGGFDVGFLLKIILSEADAMEERISPDADKTRPPKSSASQSTVQ